MNIIELAREADLDWHIGWTLDDDEPNRFVTFANAVIAARDAELIAGVGEPVAYKTDDIELYVREEKFGFYDIPLYTASQVAGVVAKANAEIEGWKADQKENMQIQVDQHKRIAELEAANLDLRKWVDATGQGLMLERIATLESTLRVALEALDSKYIIGCNAVIKQIKRVLHD